MYRRCALCTGNASWTTVVINGIMQIARYRNIIVAILMMTFIGQAVASTNASCQSQPSQPQEQMMDSAIMDHSQHIGLNASSTAAAIECCLDCDCSLGGCTTAVLPASQPVFASNLTSLTSSYNELTENPLAFSLFRPPISR